jgi:hypothetical protein
MVNSYNISIKLQAKILQNDPWVGKNITEQSSGRNLTVGVASIGTIGGEAGIAFFFFVLLVPLILTLIFNSI